MGCDIHDFIEVKDKETQTWVMLTRAEAGRSYLWFSIIANVRNYSDVEPIDEPRGLPEDCSILIRRELGGDGDIHSSSYLSLQEITLAWQKYLDAVGKDTMDELEVVTTTVLDVQITYKDKLKRYRDSNGHNDLPIMDVLVWHGDLGDDLSLKLDESAWYDDVRYVFGFDN